LVDQTESSFNFQEKWRVSELLGKVGVKLLFLGGELGEARFRLGQVQEVKMVIPFGTWNQAIDGINLFLLDLFWLVLKVGGHHISLVGFQI
jgi:hypothetical protein